MARIPNTTRTGGQFDPGTLRAVWARARIVQGYDPRQVRMDCCGAWIAWAEYGRTTDFGWEVDHVRPVEQGGGDELANLQPLHWRNNRGKSDHFPQWNCTVCARS
jgi:5-methylcytosine-specific restriction endonuclease McrA